MPTTTVDCDCRTNGCTKKVKLPIPVALAILHQEDQYVIVDGCQRGAEKSDQLVEQRDGYTLYRES
ncbi:MAG: hypothetical protein MUP45_02225 [Candidatus Marinimicrobia bacterium]|nr:hypothetical protein [Candidatus Neomarinimicrobiota bacterium]